MALIRSIGIFRLVVAVILLLVAGGLARFPARNGDLPYYIAAAYAAQGLTDSNALKAAAGEIRTSLDPAAAAIHLQNLGATPDRFLDFYRIKGGYTAAVIFFHRLGFSYVDATLVPSLIAFVILGWGIFMFCVRMFNPVPALLFGLLLLAGTGVLQLGRTSTPDAVSQCLLFWAIYRVRFAKPAFPTILFLLISLLFRPDNLPAAAGLMLVMAYVGPKSESALPSGLTGTGLLAALTAALICCAVLNLITEPRFWWFRPVPYPGVVNHPDPHRNIHFLKLLFTGPFPVLLALAAIWSGVKGMGKTWTVLLIFLLLMVPVRFLLFPHYEDRFFIAFFLGALLLPAGELAGKREGGTAGGTGSPARATILVF